MKIYLLIRKEELQKERATEKEGRRERGGREREREYPFWLTFQMAITARHGPG